MSNKRVHMFFFVVLLILGRCLAASGQSDVEGLKQCDTRSTIDAWVNCIIEKVATPLVNQRNSSSQVEVPSIADNTTALVDQTTAPDLAGLALNLAGLNSKAGGGKDTAISFSTSAYALYATAVHRNVLDPQFYMDHPDLRRFTFSLGQDSNPDAATANRAFLVGFKALILNKRDIAHGNNRQKLVNVSQALRAAAAGQAAIFDEITTYLFQQLGPQLQFCGQPAPPPGGNAVAVFLNSCVNGPALTNTLAQLTTEQRQQIKKIVMSHIDEQVRFLKTNGEEIWKIRRAPQLSFTFQSKLRDGKGDDEYRAGLLFDYGVYQKLNLSINGTFDYKDSKVIGGDTRAGRIGAEGIFQLTPRRSLLGDSRPWLLSTSAEAKWPNDHKNTYTGQVKLTIPIPGMTGVNFPISVSVANRSDLIKEKVVRGKFGFTVDITKLLSKAP